MTMKSGHWKANSRRSMRNRRQGLMLQAGRPMAVVPGGSNKNEEVKLDL
jgi:hypothetical protein